MPRRYYRRRTTFVRSKRKYSWEHYNFAASNADVAARAAWNAQALMVAASAVGGMRKCKNFTLSINSSQFNQPIWFALVYVPEGTVPSNLKLGGVDNPQDNPGNANYITSATLYEPNQNVILTGIIPSNQTANQIKSTRMARNLNSGDAIFLIWRTAVQEAGLAAGAVNITANLDYCITY